MEKENKINQAIERVGNAKVIGIMLEEENGNGIYLKEEGVNFFFGITREVQNE